VQFEERRNERLRYAPRFDMLVADHVAGKEREHGADLVARDVTVFVAVERRDLPNLEVVDRAAGDLGADHDVLARLADVVAAEAVIDEHAVSAAPGCLQRLWMRGGEKYRWYALDPRQMCARSGKRRRLPAQQRLDEGDAIRELVRARLREPHVLGAAVSGADAEQGAPVRDVVERGDRGRADGGMAADQIGDADRNARAARTERNQ